MVPPPANVVKISVHCVFDEVPEANENSNSLGIIARDHDMVFLWGVMGPFKDVVGVESQL